MPDRIVRDELLESDRWLDLPTDASRLAFVGFLLICDDFGNFEGGPRRLFRFIQQFTQIKTEDASAAVIDDLMACDLIRRYQHEGRELFHIPRFKSHRQYLSRSYPSSPWCKPDVTLGKDKRVINKGLAKNVVTTSLLQGNDVAEGVGVGVGVLHKALDLNHLTVSPPSDQSQNLLIKKVLKTPQQIEEQIERNREIAEAVRDGDLEKAKRLHEEAKK